MTDLISRQAAMDALDKLCDIIVCQYTKKQRSVMCVACPLGGAFDTIEELPSAEKEAKTNADRIHSMTDEELATWLGDMLGVYPFGTDQWDRQAWLDWLKKEVDE